MQEKRKVYVGIDPSLSCTGVVILYNNCNNCDVFTIKTKAKENPDCRINQILVEVCKIIDLLRFIYDVYVVIEGLSFYSATNTGLQLAGLNYVLRNYFLRNQINYYILPPTSLKKYITGNGRANKKEVIEAVNKRWNFNSKNDNECDAFGLAKYCQEKFGDI